MRLSTGPVRAVIERDAIRFAHLPQNFRLAQHHRIQARRNAKQVPHRLAIAPPVQAAAQHRRVQFGETSPGTAPWPPRCPRADSGGTPYSSLRLHVESTSVSESTPPERNSSAALRAGFRRERNALAQLHRRGAWFNPMSTISIGASVPSRAERTV